VSARVVERESASLGDFRSLGDLCRRAIHGRPDALVAAGVEEGNAWMYAVFEASHRRELGAATARRDARAAGFQL